MQPEDLLRGDAFAALRPGSVDVLAQRRKALRERPPEALLLGGQPHVRRLRVLDQFRVGATHQLPDERGVAGQEARLEPQVPSLLDRPAHHSPQHIAAILVGGHHAVGSQERHRPRVVGEDPQRPVGLVVIAVGAPRQRLPELDQRRELVGLEDRLLLLQDRRETVQAEARVDVVRRQGAEHGARAVGPRTPLALVVLHEHEVPVLQEPLVVAARQVLGQPVGEAAVHVQLRARSARTRRARFPEVLRA